MTVTDNATATPSGLVAGLAAAALALSACGGSSNAAPKDHAPTSALATDAGAPKPMLVPTDVVIPPVRPVPPLTLGSTVASVQGAKAGLGDPPAPACAGSASDAAALAKACSGNAKPLGSAQTLTLNEKDVGPTIPLAATRACYRLFASAQSQVEGFVVDVIDSKGAIAAEGRTSGRTLVVPAEGPLCFQTDDAAKIVVSAAKGSGSGSLIIVKE